MQKLIALDMEDLTIVSAHMQDAVTSVARMAFDAQNQAFVLEMNRFVWENSKTNWNPFTKRKSERRNCILHVAQVQSVSSQGINRKKSDVILSLFAVQFMPGKTPSGQVELVFAGNKTLRLDVECLEVQMTDMGGAWAAGAQPHHGVQ